MFLSAFNLTNALGTGGFLLSLIAYCVIRRILNGGLTPSRLRCSARVCILVGLCKLCIGIFEILYLSDSGGSYWGSILILFSIFWLIRGQKFKRQANNVSLGYPAFNNDSQQQRLQPQAADAQDATEHRVSNAPQVIIISEPALTAARGSNNNLSQPFVSAAEIDTPLIRNAVPPSPFTCAQGNDSYIVPSIMLSNMTRTMTTTTTTPPSDICTVTPRTQRTLGFAAATQQHTAEASICSDDNNDHDNKEDDGKNEVEVETPKGPTQSEILSNVEGNPTFS